jgi:hypothetical protein
MPQPTPPPPSSSARGTRFSVMRRVLAIILLWLPAAAISLLWLAWADRLPAQLPTHWGASGPADAATDTTTVLAWCLSIAAAAALSGTAVVVIPLRNGWLLRAVVAVLGSTAGLASGIWLMSSGPSVGATDPYTVELGPWGLATFVTILYGILPLALVPTPSRPPVAVSDGRRIVPFETGAGATAAWSRR